jgi:hypothetical protein
MLSSKGSLSGSPNSLQQSQRRIQGSNHLSSGTPSSNLSHRTCIAKTGLNALFARSRTTSWKFLPALTPPFPRTFGTFFCHRLSSPSIFSVRSLSTQGLVCGIFSKGPSASARHHLVDWLSRPHPCKAGYSASWDFRAKLGFHIGPALDSYHCFKLVKSNTKSQVISDTVKFCHLYLSVPVPSTKDKIIHGLQVITGTIRGAPPPTSVSQLEAITSLKEIFESWCTLAPPALRPTHRLAPSP